MLPRRGSPAILVDDNGHERAQAGCLALKRREGCEFVPARKLEAVQ
jgi:hypothetical protein